MSNDGNNLQSKKSEMEAEIKQLLTEKEQLKDLISPETGSDLMSICKMLSAGYFVFDPVEQHIYHNDTLATLFDKCIPAFPFTIKDLIENAHVEDQEFLKDVFAMPKGSRKKLSGQFRLTYQSNEIKEVRSYSLTGRYNEPENGKLLLTCVIRDITKEIKQLRDLQRSLEKAEEADRIKTIFLLNISHNIRTPMNSILGFAELLHLTNPVTERRIDYIRTIKRQSQNLLQLLDDVSEIAKFESGTLTITHTPVNLNLLLNEVLRDVESIRSSARKEHVKISIDIPAGDGIELFSDAGRLYQIFINLINHSLKYTSKGSIKLGYSPPMDNRIEFFVKDTSENLEKNELKDLFEKYTKVPEGGTGRYDDDTRLNLTIARSIVKLLGGKIAFEYEEGAGSTFTFSFPYEAPPLPKTEIPEDELIFQQKYNWKDKVILIVEDEEVNGIFLEAVLHETGAKSLYAKNGRQAIDLCQSINKIDLILMDIRMPVLNGLKATQEIRKFNHSIPIIAQTALALEEDREQCLHAGCNDTITKPIEIEELLELVSRYLSH